MKIRIDHIAKIEGHASFVADIVKGDVKSARIKVVEGARLIEGIMLGRDFEEVPEIGSRICGICPVVHNLTAWKALEASQKIKPSPQTIQLRKLMMLGQIINSHALHLFFFSLADFFGFENDMELINRYPEKTHDALELRDTANQIIEVVGGRSIHPVSACLGGFRTLPKKAALQALAKKCQVALDPAKKMAKLFSQLTYPPFERQMNFVSLSNKEEYAIYGGAMKTLTGLEMPSEKFMPQIQEKQTLDLVTKRAEFKNEPYMLGALARMNNNWRQLNPAAKKMLKESILVLPSFNPFHNILCQAIEIVHCFEEAIKIINNLFKKTLKENASVCQKLKGAGKGIGAIEAPRGTLFYNVELTKNGSVKNINIITPTAQNLDNLERDLEEMIPELKKMTEQQRQKKIKMLIRAYDPCITCATH